MLKAQAEMFKKTKVIGELNAMNVFSQPMRAFDEFGPSQPVTRKNFESSKIEMGKVLSDFSNMTM